MYFFVDRKVVITGIKNSDLASSSCCCPKASLPPTSYFTDASIIFINIRSIIHDAIYFARYQLTVVPMALIDIYSTTHAAIFPRFCIKFKYRKRNQHTKHTRLKSPTVISCYVYLGCLKSSPQASLSVLLQVTFKTMYEILRKAKIAHI